MPRFISGDHSGSGVKQKWAFRGRGEPVSNPSGM